MFIFLEGVDGSGKSSLATEIARQLREKYPLDEVSERHSGPLDSDPIDEYAFSLEFYVPGSGRHIVADRWHWGEMVYGPIYRGGSAMNDPTFFWIDAYLSAKGAYGVLVTNTLETINQRLESRGEDFLQPEHVSAVISAFDAVASTSTSHCLTVQVGETTPTDVLARDIILRAEELEERAHDIYESSSSYVGTPNPKYLLVGDKRGGQAPYVTDGAFFPVSGNSAVYLWNALLTEDAYKDIALVNAREECSLLELIDHITSKSVSLRILALGAEASKVLTSLGVSHGKVPHPQFVRRFHNSKQAEYGALIYSTIESQEDKSKWPK